MPRRRAARKMVSPSRMSTSRSSMVKVLGLSPELELMRRSSLQPPSPRGAPRDTRVAGTPLRGPIVRHTLASGIWVPAYAGTTRESFAASSSPTPERLRQLFREILQHAQQRVGRRLAEPADRGVAHGVGELR